MSSSNFQADSVDSVGFSVKITSYGDGSYYSVELTNCETIGDVGILFAQFSAYVHECGYDCDELDMLVRAACGEELD